MWLLTRTVAMDASPALGALITELAWITVAGSLAIVPACPNGLLLTTSSRPILGEAMWKGLKWYGQTTGCMHRLNRPGQGHIPQP